MNFVFTNLQDLWVVVMRKCEVPGIIEYIVISRVRPRFNM